MADQEGRTIISRPESDSKNSQQNPLVNNLLQQDELGNDTDADVNINNMNIPA